ncbi:polymer-forming cytoskeletal protein [Pseudodesulfovibrio sp. F-1]|uniref:Polymer-forming cytoskeletal protein n=1 Tax=Pseudodesulfovibrio alkaliphilus TaxID=2661613 RepID=A0A7K1KMZ5_9BACT|nr:polymer-forming cytoskeletal protein [Pseudodesulfovibrio alkaliphilus]MUM77439.1 polymer-forming cytoskeletal protein [Pseudodesulfovibrio alkaliphilus]
MARDEINAFLGAGTNYQGKLNFQGAVRIDGNFKGEVVSDGTLVVGQEAVVEGQIRVGQLVLSGKLLGEVDAANKVVLHKTANLLGNIRTPVLVVEEGAVLEGQLVMGSLDTATPNLPSDTPAIDND